MLIVEAVLCVVVVVVTIAHAEKFTMLFSSSPMIFVTVAYAVHAVRTLSLQTDKVFTARRYASSVYAMVVCVSDVRPSVCPSVCLSQVGVLLKWLNIGTRKQHHTIAQGL